MQTTYKGETEIVAALERSLSKLPFEVGMRGFILHEVMHLTRSESRAYWSVKTIWFAKS